jgi:hypothetical protein
MTNASVNVDRSKESSRDLHTPFCIEQTPSTEISEALPCWHTTQPPRLQNR